MSLAPAGSFYPLDSVREENSGSRQEQRTFRKASKFPADHAGHTNPPLSYNVRR
jgi:hypothetical protein